MSQEIDSETFSSKDILEIFRNIPEEYRSEVFDMLDKEITVEIDQEILNDLKRSLKNVSPNNS